MATRRFGLSQGEVLENMTEAVGAAVTTDSFEFTVDLSVNPTREQVLNALEYIEMYITKVNWPPA